MAGRRKGTGRPQKRLAGVTRRRAQLADELAVAVSPAARVAAAADYVRAALVLHPADRGVGAIVDYLIAEGDRIHQTAVEHKRPAAKHRRTPS